MATAASSFWTIFSSSCLALPESHEKDCSVQPPSQFSYKLQSFPFLLAGAGLNLAMQGEISFSVLSLNSPF